MAKQITDEELEEINKKIKDNTTLSINENSYTAMLDNLGKQEGYDYLADYDVLKNSKLTQSYSPRTNKVYTYEEAQSLTPQQYWEDVMSAADHTDTGTSKEDLAKSALKSVVATTFLGPLGTPSVIDTARKALTTNTGKTFVWGINEATGGSALYKAVKGEEAVANKLNQIERVYGNNQVARGLGNAVGTIASQTIGATLGGVPGSAIAGGISGAGRAYTYSDNPTDIIAGGASGAMYGAVRGLTAGALKNAIASSAPSLSTSFGANALAQGAGAYTGSALSGTTANVINAASGKEVSKEDWLKPFTSPETLLNTALSAVIGGALDTAKMRSAVKSVDTEANSKALSIEQALKAGDKATADAIAISEIDSIEKFTNGTTTGVKFSDAFKTQMIDDWAKSLEKIYNDNGYTINIPTSIGANNTPIVATNVPAAVTSNIPNSVGLTTTSINAGVPQTNTPAAVDGNVTKTYNENKGGIANAENNIYGMGTAERGGTGQLYLENDKRTLEEIRPNREKTEQRAKELDKLIVNDLTPEEQALVEELRDVTGLPIHIIESDEMGGMTSENGIYLNRETIREEGGKTLGYHEEGENLLYNHEDYAGLEISRLINRIVEADRTPARTMTKLFKYYYKPEKLKQGEKYGGVSNSTIRSYFKQYKKFVKQMIFNTYGASKEFGDNNDYHTMLGDEIYKDVVDSLEKLSKGKTGKGIKPTHQDGGNDIPDFAKRRKATDIQTLEKATDNLRNELAKTEDKVQATEMWSKRIERKKLNKKLDTAKDKLAQTKYDNKQKLQATKEEGKEKIYKLTSKKNQEKYEAVKEVKQQAAATEKKLKAKNKEDVREAKLDAKANTTKKKMTRASNKLEKALTNVYDKPQSKELGKALETVQKATRGATKILNRVRTQIPKSMSPVIDDINDILDTYYTGANKMTDEKRASLEKKAEAIEKFAKEHPTIPISKQALDIIKEQNKKSLADLNPKDLVDLAENVGVIAQDIRDAMSFTRADENAIKLRKEAIDFVKGELSKGGRRTTTPENKVGNTSVEFMRGYTDFNSRIDRLITNLSGGNPHSPLHFIDDRLREGTTNYFKNQEKLLGYWDKFVKVYRAPGLGKKVVNELDYVFNPKNKLDITLTTSTGESYKPSLRDAISIVLGRKDLQFAGHTTGVLSGKFDSKGNPIMTEGGYAILANQADAINGNINKGLKRGVRIKLTNEIVDKIQKELEKIPAAQDIMDTYSNSGFLKENAKIVNDAYEAITGMSIDERENYFRTVVNPNDRKIKPREDPTGDIGLTARDALLNTSIVKPVTEGANGSIYIYPIDEVINKMIDDSSIYGAFATELYDIDTFLNAVDEDGVSLREMIGHLDPDFLGELNQIEDAVIHRKHNNFGANLIAKTKNLVGNYSGSILHGNAFLALKQVGSLPTAAPFFQTPAQSILNGIFNKKGIEGMVRDYFTELGEDTSNLSDKEVFDKFFQEATTELETRKRGYTRPTKADIFKYASPMKRIEALDWYKSADIWTVNNLAYAMVYDFLANFDENISHEELIRELGSQFVKMNYSTQPNTAPYTRTLGQLSDNPLARAALYMADPRLKQLNTTIVARQNYKWSKENGTEEDKAKYKKSYAGAIIGALGGMAYTIMLNETKSKLKKKDEERTAKDVLTSVIANTISIYAIGFDMIINRFLSKDYDFDVSIPDTEVLNKVYEMGTHGNNLVKHLTNGDDAYIYKDVKNVISDISYITGIPVKNVQDDFMYFLSAINSNLYYEMKVKEDTNMYKKYLKFEDRIDSYKDYYTLYKATREAKVVEKYGKYNNNNIKKAIDDAGGDTGIYYKIFKLGN